MEFGLGIFSGVVGLLLLAFGALVIIRREQPFVPLDKGFPRTLKSWSALIVGGICLLLGAGAVLLALVINGILG